VCVCVCVRMNSLRITYIIKYNTIFEEKMGFPANFWVSFHTLLNFGFQQQEFSWAYDNIQYVQRNVVLEHCKKLYTSFVKQTNKKENYFFLWPLLKIQRSLLRRLNPSTYSAITYWHAIQGYIHYYLDM